MRPTKLRHATRRSKKLGTSCQKSRSEFARVALIDFCILRNSSNLCSVPSALDVLQRASESVLLEAARLYGLDLHLTRDSSDTVVSTSYRKVMVRAHPRPLGDGGGGFLFWFRFLGQGLCACRATRCARLLLFFLFLALLRAAHSVFLVGSGGVCWRAFAPN